VAWPEIEAVAEATRKPRSRASASGDEPRVDELGGDEPTGGQRDREKNAVRLIRQRRSAVAMDGTTALSWASYLNARRPRVSPPCSSGSPGSPASTLASRWPIEKPPRTSLSLPMFKPASAPATACTSL
jgi:hypothetical protein